MFHPLKNYLYVYSCLEVALDEVDFYQEMIRLKNLNSDPDLTLNLNIKKLQNFNIHSIRTNNSNSLFQSFIVTKLLYASYGLATLNWPIFFPSLIFFGLYSNMQRWSHCFPILIMLIIIGSVWV